MGWRDLLQASDERIVAPWVGGRSLQTVDRTFTLTKLPPNPGWHSFKIDRRKAAWEKEVEPQPDKLGWVQMGYLIGNRFISDNVKLIGSQFINDNVKVYLDPTALVKSTDEVHLVEAGLELFSRVSVGCTHSSTDLIFRSQEFPLGQEEAVMRALEDKAESLDHIRDLPPALEVAYRFEVQRRAEVERLRREERERQEREERRRRIQEQLGDGELRRQMALEDFGEAAKAALAVGGAEYLSHRQSHQPGEMVVRYKYNDRRFECVCNARTLGIIDSGICLTAHYNDPDFEGGTKGDNLFTLESLPAVIQQAIDEDKLVVYRGEDL